MSVSLLGMLMCTCWALTLIGGLGLHALTHFNGKKLEAYCRLRRAPDRFGEILDGQAGAESATQYLLLFGLVLGSLAAGAWFSTNGNFDVIDGRIVGDIGLAQSIGAVVSWLLLLTLAGLWLPKIVVRQNSSLFLFHSWWLWKSLAIVTGPFTGFADVFSWLGQRLSDEPEGEDFEEEMLEDEIRTMVTAGQREGMFSEGIPEMIQGVMDLDEADVGEIMTPRSLVDTVDLAASWDEVVGEVANCGRTRIPVYENTPDNIIGILYVKDVLSLLANKQFQPNSGTLRSILRTPWFIPASKPVDQLLRIFLHNRNHMAIVLDEYQQFVGVVTIEDALEEIVGEISDELDIEEDSELVYFEDTHHVEAEAKVPIESIGKLLGVEMTESDDYDTIGGLVIHKLSRIPTAGTEVEADGLRITVLDASRRMVKRVRLELSPKGMNAEG